MFSKSSSRYQLTADASGGVKTHIDDAAIDDNDDEQSNNISPNESYSSSSRLKTKLKSMQSLNAMMADPEYRRPRNAMISNEQMATLLDKQV